MSGQISRRTKNCCTSREVNNGGDFIKVASERRGHVQTLSMTKPNFLVTFIYIERFVVLAPQCNFMNKCLDYFLFVGSFIFYSIFFLN